MNRLPGPKETRTPLMVAALMGLLFLVAGVGDAAGQSASAQAKTLADIVKGGHLVKGLTARGQSLAEAPPFHVVPRKPSMTKFPCTGCHDKSFVDRDVRVLKQEHTKLVFDHGGGKFWCYDACHDGKDQDHLVSLRRTPVDYNRSYKVCGGCHFQQEKDWAFGGHGKRAGAWADPRNVPLTHEELRVEDRSKIGTWGKERTLLNCTACHDPHSPSIKPFEPSPPPRVRSGLSHAADAPLPREPAWQRTTKSAGDKP